MCAKNHLLIFSSFLDIWENVEWPRFWTTLYNTVHDNITAHTTVSWPTYCELQFTLPLSWPRTPCLRRDMCAILQRSFDVTGYNFSFSTPFRFRVS